MTCDKSLLADERMGHGLLTVVATETQVAKRRPGPVSLAILYRYSLYYVRMYSMGRIVSFLQY